MRSVTILALIAALASSACTQTFDSKKAFDPKMPATVPPVSGAVTEQATLRYIDIAAGTGAAALAGQQYTVHYTGWLRDGTQFDSSAGKDPLKFVQGRREVIAGFDVGFEGMKVGGKRRLFISYRLAYGDQQRGKIPPKSELIFDIERVDVKDAPQLSAAADLLLPFSELEEHVMALAKAMPEVEETDRRERQRRSGGRQGPGVEDACGEFRWRPQRAPGSAGSRVESQRGFLRDRDHAARRAGLARHPHRGHEGQLIAYARVNGIAPPWSQAAK